MRKTHFDVLIVGGGAAGCVLAARLSEDERISVGLVEAGPDYGRFDVRRWPAELLDARSAARGHDWDVDAPACCARGRVIGGSSTHNGCWAMIGAPPDYDAWSAFSGGAWNHQVLRPHLRDSMGRLRVRPVRSDDRTAWHVALIEATGAAGIPYLEDVNADTATEGAGWVPLNAVGPTRWHSAFAYLDPVRRRPNVRVLAKQLAARLEFDGDRATALVTRHGGRSHRFTADTIVLCCGTYGNPPLLMRSGVGPESVLRDLGAPVVHPLAGVGENLIDHSTLGLEMEPQASLREAMPDAAEAYFAQTVIKARSSQAADEYWDLHIVPSAGPDSDAQGRYNGPLTAGLYVSAMDPHSRGTVRAASLDPSAEPLIDHGFFTDPDGHDLRAVLDGIDLAQDLARTEPLSGLARAKPWTEVMREPSSALEAAGGYWHPVGTCAMGPAEDPMAVADERGRLHGLENVYVGDASLMPVIPRANTHVTTVAVADRLGVLLNAALTGASAKKGRG